MKLFKTWFLGVLGLFVLNACGLYGPKKPYNQGDLRDPLVLDQQHPEKPRATESDRTKPIDYLFPWRLARNR